MKKLLAICFIAASAVGITSAANGKHYVVKDYSVYSDTTPMGMDTSMHKKGNKGKMHHKMNKDSGMSMQSDSASTAPPRK